MNIVTLVPNEGYTAQIIHSIKDAYDNDKKICYVTLNRPHNSVVLQCQASNLSVNRLLIVDAITRTVQPNIQSKSNVLFVSSPAAMDEIDSTVKFLLERQKFSAVVLDSLSTLLLYSTLEELQRFLLKLSARISLADCEGIFLYLKESTHPEVMSALNNVADKIIDMG